MDRAALDVDTLLRIVLVLVVIWLVLEILDMALGMVFGIFWFLKPLLALALLVLIVLWLLDKI